MLKKPFFQSPQQFDKVIGRRIDSLEQELLGIEFEDWSLDGYNFSFQSGHRTYHAIATDDDGHSYGLCPHADPKTRIQDKQPNKKLACQHCVYTLEIAQGKQEGFNLSRAFAVLRAEKIAKIDQNYRRKAKDYAIAVLGTKAAKYF